MRSFHSSWLAHAAGAVRVVGVRAGRIGDGGVDDGHRRGRLEGEGRIAPTENDGAAMKRLARAALRRTSGNVFIGSLSFVSPDRLI